MEVHLQQLKAACARISCSSTGQRGTAFLARPQLLITCAHVVGQAGNQVSVQFFDEATPRDAIVVWSELSPGRDCAVIRLTQGLDGGVPLELGTSVSTKAPWHAFGFPAAAARGSASLHGTVADPDGRDLLGRPTLCLFSKNVTVGTYLQGFSGSPVVSDGRVIGMLAQIIPKPDAAGELAEAEYGLIYARPCVDLHMAIYEGLRSGPVRLVTDPSVLATAVSHRSSPIREALHQSARRMLERYQPSSHQWGTFIARRRADLALQDALPPRGCNWIQVVAPAGAGKTTWSLHRAVALSEVRSVAWLKATELPFGESDPLTQTVLRQCGNANLNGHEVLRELHLSGSLIFFLDGLEEVTNYDHLKTALHTFRLGQLGPYTHLVLLCREESLTGLQPYLDEVAPRKPINDTQELDPSSRDSQYIKFAIHPLSENKARELLKGTGATPNQAMEVYFKLPVPYNGRPFFLLRALEIYKKGSLSPQNSDILGALMESYIEGVYQKLRKDGKTLLIEVIRRFIHSIAREAIFDPHGRVARDKLIDAYPMAGETGESSLVGRCVQAGLLSTYDEQWVSFSHALLLEYYAAQAIASQGNGLDGLLNRLMEVPARVLGHTLGRIAPMLLEPEPLLQALLLPAPLICAEVAATVRKAIPIDLKCQIVDALEPMLQSHFPSDWNQALVLLSGLSGDYASRRCIAFFNSKTSEEKKQILASAAFAFLRFEVKEAFHVILTHPGIRSNYYYPSTTQSLTERSEEFQKFLVMNARASLSAAATEPWKYLSSLKILAIFKDYWLADYLRLQLKNRTLSQDENHALIIFGTKECIDVYITNFDLVSERIRKIKNSDDNREEIDRQIEERYIELYPRYADVLDNPNLELKEWARIALESPIHAHVNFGLKWAIFFADETFLSALNTAALSWKNWTNIADKADKSLKSLLEKMTPGALISAYDKYPGLRKSIVQYAYLCPGKHTEDFLNKRLEDPSYRFSAIQSLGFLGSHRSAPRILSYIDGSDVGYFAQITLASINYLPVILDLIVEIESELSTGNPRSLMVPIYRIGEFGLPELLPILEEIYRVSRCKENRTAVVCQILWSKVRDASARVVSLLKADPNPLPSLMEIIGSPYVSVRHHPREVMDPESLRISNEELWKYLLQEIRETGVTSYALRAASTFILPQAEQFLEAVATNAETIPAAAPSQSSIQPRSKSLQPLKTLQEEAQMILARRGRPDYIANIVDKACQGSHADPFDIYWSKEELGALSHTLVASALRRRIEEGSSTANIMAARLFVEGGYAQIDDASLLSKLETHTDLLIADLAHQARLELCPDTYQDTQSADRKELPMNSHILDLARLLYQTIRPHSRGTISYSEVCSQLTGKWAGLNPDSELLAAALGVIVSNCRGVGLPALSAIVVHKDGDKMPGNGYFSAAHPGLSDLPQRQIAWANELGAVHQANYPPALDDLGLSKQGPQTPPNAAVVRDQVFLSYSHDDVDFLNQLRRHLAPFVRAGRVSAWSDQQIAPGSQWFDEIRAALMKTKVAVMLVTSSFLASDFVHNHELGPLLKEAAAGGVCILWVPVRACSWKATPLKNYQAAIPPDKPLAEMTAKRDAAWVKICEKIEEALNSH